MRKKFLLMFLVLSLFSSMGGGRLFAQNGNVEISTVSEFKAFAESVNDGTSYEGQTVTLTTDLTLSGEWAPIGNGSRSSKSYSGNAFKGTFDGGDHTISGLTIKSTSGADAAIGLFGIVDGGTVKNLNLTDVNINVASSNLAGAAIGMMLNGATANYITVSGAIVGNDGVGGIVGRLIIHGTISNCINNASVTSSYGGIGGIVGKPYYEDGANTSTFASITNCTNNGTVTAPMYVGGIAGLARANVTGCTNNGEVKGGTQTGGIIGQLIAAGTVSGNENKVKISGKNHLGGIIGDYSQSSAYTYYNVSIENNINRGELAATEQCAAIMGCNNIDGFTEMTATGNVSYYYVEGLELFGNPEDMVIDETNKFIIPVAQVGEQTFYTFAEAVAAAQAGDEIILLANIEGDITVPANVTLNGNGFAISGGILAEGDITFAGVTTAADFDANVANTAVNIPAGASLQLTGTARLVIGHGATFNITGTIENAKTADKATLVPSLKIAAGASITGNGVTFNVNNAYIVANANTTSKNSNANGTLDFNIDNSIWEQTGVLAFYVPTSGKDPVVNFELKNSVLTTTSHLVFSVTKGEIVIDNSLVNQGASRQIENRSKMTIKNGAVVNGAVATSSNAINPGTIIVENATYAVTGEFSGAAEGTGTLIIKKGANVSVGSIKAGANVTVDAEGMTADDEINFTANLSQFTGTLSVINNDNLDAEIIDGKIVLVEKPVAQIGDVEYATLQEAIDACEGENNVITLLSDITFESDLNNAGKGYFNIADGKKVVLDMNGKTINVTDKSTGNFIVFYNYGEFTVANGTINLTSTNDREWNAESAIFLNRGGIFNIENGIYTHNGGTDMAFVVDNSGNYYGDATTNIYERTLQRNTVTTKLTSSYIAIRNRMEQNSHGASGEAILNVHGGTISGTSRAIWAQAASTSETAPATGEINVKGGNIGLIDTPRSTGAVSMTTISGGTVSAFKGEVGELTVTEEGTLNEVTLFTAAGETVNDYAVNEDGLYVQAVAQVGETKYTDLQEAIKAAAPAGTVEILADVVVDEWIMFSETLNISSGQIITMNIDGLTINGNGKTVTIKSIESASNGNRLFYDATKLNINYWTIKYADGVAGGIGLTSGTINNVTIEGGAGVFPGTGNITISECNFKTSGHCIYFEEERDNLVVTKNTFELPADANVILLRGDVEFTDNIVVSGRTVNVVSGSPEVTGNDFGQVRFKVYNEATATIEENTINNLVFNKTDVPTESTFTDNTLSAEAQAAIDALPVMAGDGTEANPYTIGNLAQLKAFRDDVNAGNTYQGKYVVLAADIDLNNEEWTPIGNKTNQFQGYFDGNNKTISNLKVTGNTSHKGFFGYIKGTGMYATTTPSVKDLTLDGVNVNVEGDGNYVGGLAGQAYTCNITKVTVKGNVSGVRYVGGLVGHVYTYFKDCHFIGNASCSFDALGGIAGAGDCRAYDCSVIGDVTGSNWVGGIVGNGQEGTSAVRCYVKGDVKTSTNWYFGVGGIAGVAGHGYSSSEFKNNYFDGEVYLEGEKVPAMIIGIVNAENNETINATIEGNSWNTTYYDVNIPVYVTAEAPQNGTTENWIAGASEELTKPRNNNLIMLESDLQYVTEEDYVIMSFSEVTEEQVEQALINNAVAKIGETTYTTLQKALDAAAAGTGNVTVEIIKDIDLTNVDWNPVTVSAPGYPVVTVNGNNKTITGLNDMLFAGTWAGNSGLIIKDLTIENSAIVNDKDDAKGTVGVGAFIGYPQASATITLDNCHLKNSSVEGGHWTGGLIGMAGGYNGEDGPVFMNLTIKGCSVTGSTITGKGSVGGIIGHGSCAAWTSVDIDETTVSDNTITSTGSSNVKAGAIMGTIGAAGQPTTANGVTLTGGATVSATVADNTVTSGGTTITTIYGRQGTPTGMLELAGGSYDKYPIEEGVTYAAPVEGYEIVENTNGTYGVEKSAVAKIGDVEYKYLQAAFDAAQNDATIMMIADVTVAEEVIIDNTEKAVTLDMNGKTWNGAIKPSNAKLTIKNGTINNENVSISAIEITSGELNLNGVNIASARHAVRIDGDVEATINGGTYKAAQGSGKGTYHAANISGNANVTITDGKFVGPKGTSADSGSALKVQSSATVTIEGGDFSGGKNHTLSADGNLIVKGGTFDQDPSAYKADDYTVQINKDGKYEVLFAVAMVETTYYADLHEAMVAAKSGETVKLVNDVDLAGTEWEPVSFKGIFDGQDHIISNLTINKPGVSNTGFITSLNGTFKNVTFTNPTVTGGDCTAVVAGRAGGGAAYAHNITINGTIKVETTHSGYARTGGIVGGWAYGKYENITIDGGDKATSYIKHTGGGDGRYVAGIVGHADDVESYTKCTVKNITISGGWLCGGIAGPGPADGLATGCSVENIDMGADYSGGMFGWYYGDGTIKDATVKDVTFTDGSTNNGIIGGYDQNTGANVENLTYENVQNSNGKPLLDHVASIGNNHYFTFEAALDAVKNSETKTITLLNRKGSEISKEIDFTEEITFTITGNAPNYALPVVTFQNATVNIEDATILIPELDARQDATINVIDSKVYDAGGNSIAKSYYNGAINISGTSEVYMMQVTTMGYINISDNAELHATWQTNVYGNGLITLNEGATFNTAALHLTGQDYSNRDNTDAERAGKPAEIVVDGANFTVGKVLSAGGADYSYNSSHGINVGTVEGKSAILNIKNGGNVNIYMANGETANIGAGGTVNIAASTLNTICRAENGTVTLANNGTVYVTGTANLAAANVTGAGWFYMNGVTLDADTELSGAKVGFINGVNTIKGSTIDNGFFSVGIGQNTAASTAAAFAEANGIALGNVTVNVSENAIIGGNGETYSGWVGSAYSADKTQHTYTLNVTNSLAAFGYMHVSKDGAMTIDGHSVNKYTFDNANVDFYAGDFIVNGNVTINDADAWVKFTKMSVDHADGVLNITGDTNYESSIHNGSTTGTSLKFFNAGTVNIEATSIEATPTVEIDNGTVLVEGAELNIASANVIAKGDVTGNGTINFTALAAKLTAQEGLTIVDEVNNKDYKVVYKEGTYQFVPKDYVAQIGEDNKFETLQDAFNAATEGQTVTVINDVELESTVTIAAGKVVTLDLNGKTINTAWEDESAEKHYYAFDNKGTLTITDSSTEANGVINARGNFNYGELTLEKGTINGIDFNGGYAVRNYNGATFTMNGGAINVYESDPSDPAVTGNYDATALYNQGTATLTAGNITSTSNFTYAVQNEGTLTIEDGMTIKGRGGVSVYNGVVTVEGGNIQNDKENNTTGHAFYVAGGELVINEGNITATNDKNDGNSVVYVAANAKATINGGNFTTDEYTKAPYGPEGCNIVITGGTFDKKPEDAYIAEGYEAVQIGENVYEVRLSSFEKFYTAAGVETTSDNAAYSLSFTVTDYASKEVSVKIGSKKPAQNSNINLVTPSEVQFEDLTFNVTSVANNGFNGTRFKTITISNGVRTLGTKALANMYDLTSVVFPSTLVSVGDNCFHGYGDSHKIKSITSYAVEAPAASGNWQTVPFQQCIADVAVLIVPNAVSYEEYATAPGWSRFYEEPNGGLINHIIGIGTELEIAGKDNKYTMIATITSMNPMECSIKIGQKPASNSNAELVIPTSVDFVESIEGFDFTVTSIPNNAFSTCYNFTGNLEIPATVKTIGNSAFLQAYYNTLNVGKLTLNEGLETILNSAFTLSYFDNENLVIPTTVTTIGSHAFNATNMSGTLTVQNNIPGGFNGFAGSLFTKVVVEEGVTSIVDSSSKGIFSNMSKLETVILPSTLEEIGVAAFSKDHAITTITINATVPPTVQNANVFEQEVYSNATLFVPDHAAKKLYKEANVWEKFANISTPIITQTTQLSAGWNWFSAYVETDLASLQSALVENGVQISSQTGFSTNFDGNWMGSLTTVSSTNMYNIYSNAETNVEISGELIDYNSVEITLHNKWNWISYPMNQNMSINYALNKLTPSNFDQISSQEAFATYFEGTGWVGSLLTLESGKGYKYYSQDGTEKSFTYTYTSTRGETKANITAENNHWVPNASQYANNMTMTAMVDVEGGDYEVAAFVDGEVRGSARPIYVEALDSYMLFLTIHGEGVEEMTFKFYDLATGEEYALNDRMNYSDDAIVGSLKEPYMFNRGTTGIGEASLSDINIYPNPTTTGKEINLQATCDKVEVFNALGVKVAEYQNVDSIDAIETAGIYVIRITNGGNVKHCSLVVK